MWFHCLMKLSKACMGIHSENLVGLRLQQKEVALFFRGRMFLFVFVIRQDHIS